MKTTLGLSLAATSIIFSLSAFAGTRMKCEYGSGFSHPAALGDARNKMKDVLKELDKAYIAHENLTWRLLSSDHSVTLDDRSNYKASICITYEENVNVD